MLFAPNLPPLPPITDPILLQDCTALAEWIRKGKRSAEQVVSAYIQRAKAVNVSLNAMVDDRYEAAVREAREVDRILATLTETQREALKETKPLLGVPFTCKEVVMMQGMNHTGGLVTRKGIKANVDAEANTRLKQAGAIAIGVTNVPEIGIWCETTSTLYGRSNNPYDFTRTPGGSSGGESSLLSGCGTPLSVGSDVGGSIRMPAYFTGTFGHKPSPEWVSLINGAMFPEKVKNSRVLAIGPLCRSARDLTLTLEVMAPLKAKGLRSKVDKTNLSKVKIWWAEGLDTPIVSPTNAAQKKALKEAVTYLNQAYGARTERSDAWLSWEWLRFWCGFGRFTFGLLMMATVQKLSKVKEEPKNSPHYWKNKKKMLIDKLGSNSVLIIPMLPRHYYHNEILTNALDVSHTALFNATEMPGSAVPLGLDNEGMPLGVQVVALPDDDHLCMAVAEALEKKFGGWISPSPIAVK
ncbi:hypothetical protein Pmani_028379 [Petrolisthes manimaculis]|uniref:Amidase domain-containing protein n=1 Tax=Petrolisthes manimaculis TaxID=1843537 RepID=A0AAE1P1S2_9EUCA|nr:hypothetical protein Pmani_028379 [Petrolisthes manimaculis]